MKTDTKIALSMISIVFGLVILLYSPFLYDVMTLPDSDPPYEPIDYNRAAICTVIYIIPGILMMAFGIILLIRIRNSLKPPPENGLKKT